MATHRLEIDTTAGPATQGSHDGQRTLVIDRVRLFDGPDVVDGLTGLPAGEEDVYTDLPPVDARRLAIRLLQDAEQAEQQSRWPR